MTREEGHFLMSGILIGLKKAAELFRQSTDAKGGCHILSEGEKCRCFLCLCDEELAEVKQELDR